MQCAPPAKRSLKSDLRERVVRSLRRRLLGAEDKRFRDAASVALSTPSVVHLRDEGAFLLGILNLLVTEAVLLVHPRAFTTWFFVWLPTLLLIRSFSYTQRRWQIFMLDFCYAANVLTGAALVLPSPLLFWTAFVVAAGPVATALVAWRNSLVFHDIDKTTTVVVHAFPALATFCVRWLGLAPSGLPYCASDGFPSLGWVRSMWPPSVWDAVGQASGCEPVPSFASLWLLGMAFYVGWQALYLVVTEVPWLLGGWLEAHPEQQTSMRWLVRSKTGAMHRISRAAFEGGGCLRRDEPLNAAEAKTKGIFVTSQLVFTAVTLLPGMLSAVWFEFNALWLVTLLVAAAFNGARYYVEVFARRYAADVEKQWSETVERVAAMAADAATEASAGTPAAAAHDGDGDHADDRRGDDGDDEDDADA